MIKLLIVDDSNVIRSRIERIYSSNFEIEVVAKASNGKEAVYMLEEHSPDIVTMDLTMPEMDGMETCVKLRENPKMNGTVIAMLTARGEDYSQIAGFDSGADDYITKQIKPRVLVSRVKALLRRGVMEVEGEPQIGISINKEKYVVVNNGQELSLPKKEFELLSLLISQPDRVFTRQTILSSVWGNDVIVGDRTIDVHIRKLREKLGDNHFKTVKGVGYKFEP